MLVGVVAYVLIGASIAIVSLRNIKIHSSDLYQSTADSNGIYFFTILFTWFFIALLIGVFKIVNGPKDFTAD